MNGIPKGTTTKKLNHNNRVWGQVVVDPTWNGE